MWKGAPGFEITIARILGIAILLAAPPAFPITEACMLRGGRRK
jgi:hypothetical protein